jgi:hypothetical protein
VLPSSRKHIARGEEYWCKRLRPRGNLLPQGPCTCYPTLLLTAAVSYACSPEPLGPLPRSCLQSRILRHTNVHWTISSPTKENSWGVACIHECARVWLLPVSEGTLWSSLMVARGVPSYSYLVYCVLPHRQTTFHLRLNHDR